MSLSLSQIPKFKQLKEQILYEIKDLSTQKEISRIKKNISNITKAEKDIQTSLPQQAAKLSFNIVLEFLKSHDLNYTYNMLVNEGKFALKDVVYAEDLRILLGFKQTDKQIRKHYLQRYTTLDIMVQQLQKLGYEKSDNSTQTLVIDPSINAEQMFNKRYEAMKQQLTKIYEEQSTHKQKAQYSVDTLRQEKIREQMKILFEEEYENRYKAKSKLLDAKQQMLKRRQSEFIRQYSSKMDDIKQENIRVKEQSALIKQRLKDALNRESSHKCEQNEQYKKMVEFLTSQRLKLKELERKYNLALSNLNTKVEDIIAQKEMIIIENKNFNINKQRRLKLDDVTSKKLLEAISNLDARVSVLAKDNMVQIKQNDTKSKQVSYLQAQLRRTQQLLLSEQSISQKAMEANRNNIINKSIATNVNERQILDATTTKTEIEREEEDKQIFRIIQESNKNKLNYLTSLDRINIEMSFIKAKVRDLVESQSEG